MFYEVGKHIVLFKYALAILFLKPFHFRTLAFGKSFTAGHTGFPLVCKLGEPLIPALASQVCVSVHPVLHPRIVNLKPPLAVHAAEPARREPYAFGVDVLFFHALSDGERLEVGIGGVDSCIAVPPVRRPRGVPRGLLDFSAVLAAGALLDDLTGRVAIAVGVSAKGVDAGIGVGEYLLLHASERGLELRAARVRAQVYNAVQPLDIRLDNGVELFFAELLADAPLYLCVCAGMLRGYAVVALMLAYLPGAHAHIVRLDDNIPVRRPYAADAVNISGAVTHLYAAEDVLHGLARAPVDLLGRAPKLVVPCLLWQDAEIFRLGPFRHAERARAYFFEPKISCTILSFNRRSASFSGRGPSFCALLQLSSLSAGTLISVPSSISTR